MLLRMHRDVRARLWILLVLVFALPSIAAAQETVNLASIAGRVLDATGAAIPGATVTVRQTATNATATVVTSNDGRFRFPYLQIGPYALRVELTGFAPAERALTLSAGTAFNLPIVLAVAGVDTGVTVRAEPAVIDTARSQIAATVRQEEIDSLPANDRSFLNIALLAPGVSPTNNGGTQLFAETSAVPGTGLSIGSQRNLSNNFLVDGLSANDDAAGLSGMPYSMDAIAEFQVVTSGAQAELGRALGGYINVVTRSGANVRHGGVYGFFGSDKLNAANALSGTKLPLSEQQFGASLGGPIAHDRTFYFANVDVRRLKQSGLTTIAVADAAAINARLDAVGYRGDRVATGQYDNPVHGATIFGKVDHRVSGADQLSARYSRYDVTSSNSRGAGGLNAPSASAGLDNTDQAVSISNTWTLAPSMVNETRAQWSLGDLQAPPSDPNGPAVSIAGVATFGTLSGSPTRRKATLLQVADNISRSAGAHALRAGVDFVYNDVDITFPRANHGSYRFSSLPQFLAGVYSNAGYTQNFGATDVAQTNPNLGMFVQDEWRAGSRLTINLGVRYDLQWLDSIETDTNNIAPRLGVAWSPDASQRTVVRANAGIFYDRVPLRPLANALLSADNTTDLSRLRQSSVSLSPAQQGAPVFPATLTDLVASSARVNVTTMDRQIQNAYSRQTSVEVERRLGERASVSASYQYLRGSDLLMSINENTPTCVAAGDNNGCRPVSAYANNGQYSSAGESTYHGLQLSLVHRPSRWGQYRVSYTLSKSMNDVGENFFNGPIDPSNPMLDWGRSDDDQRHRLVVSGGVTFGGVTASSVVRYYSALPLNITSGITTIQGTAGRPVVNGAFIERNSGTLGDFLSWDARVATSIHVHRQTFEIGVEGFNLTNRMNVVSRNGNFGSAAYPSSASTSFSNITAVGDPRSVQVLARWKF
jgi:hypothetical protein